MFVRFAIESSDEPKVYQCVFEGATEATNLNCSVTVGLDNLRGASKVNYELRIVDNF